MRSRAPIALVALFSSACYTLHPYEQVEKIPIQSTPPGALVTMTDETGSKAIGTAPLEAEVTVIRDRYEFHAAGSWILTAVSLIGTAVSLAFAIDPPDETLSTGTVRDHQLARIFGISGSILFGLSSLFMLPATISGHLSDGKDVAVRYKHGVPTFEAKLAGHTDATVRPDATVIPPKDPLTLALRPNEDTAGVLGLLGSPIDVLSQRPVLAVFDLDPGNSGVAADIASQLSEYLSAKIASGGRYRVVPRSELRDRLAMEKKTSYRDCFDESCQIELGKALAAEKTLAAKLLKVGDVCALTATVFDLKSEATDAAQTVRTDCAQSGLMDAIDSISDQLAR